MTEESDVQNIFKPFRPLRSLVDVSLPGIMENQLLGFSDFIMHPAQFVRLLPNFHHSDDLQQR